MISSDVQEKIAAQHSQCNEFGFDPYGFSPDYALAAAAPFLWLYKNYFRVQAQGLENIPPGRVILVSNHSGQLPFDAAMICVASLIEANPPRHLRAMVEKWAPTLPFVSVFFSRLGQVVGTPENARRLLSAEEALLVFPEGVRGITKLWKNRYQLTSFGMGFMRLALETQTPIVPVSVVGGEEQAMALYDWKFLARLLKMPAFPITPTLLPIPLPSRYFIRFGKPLHFSKSLNEKETLEQKVEKVRSHIQQMVRQGVQERKSVFR
jgi:1-acyl-sn-glycerol-3-phosphate acyltransferase